MKLLYYNCTFALFIFRLHKLGIEAHAYAHYTSLLCFKAVTYYTNGLDVTNQNKHGCFIRVVVDNSW